MKPTAGRVRALAFMARPDAYALPNGLVPAAFHNMPRTYRITSEHLAIFEAKAFITRGKPPYDSRRDFIYVWRITDKGRDYLAQSTEAR